LCFHPSLGIPLIITNYGNDDRNEYNHRFYPSLGIPLIIMLWGLTLLWVTLIRFPSLFRDSSDHHSAAASFGGFGGGSVSIPL
jgi:hypothetical protein